MRKQSRFSKNCRTTGEKIHDIMLFRFENRVLTGIYERREGEVTEGWNK
jgi:hypothetical protein